MSGRRQSSHSPRHAARGGRASLAAALLLPAFLLLAAASPLDAPYLDARLHTQFDDAWFAWMARNGLRNGDLRSQMGVTQNAYERWGVRHGEPSYYTHHPFLLKATFQQYARVTGTGEAAARSFALLVAFGVAAGVLLLVRAATGSLAAGLVAAVTLACVPVFARFAGTLKFESDGMLAAVVFLLAARRALARPGRHALALAGAAAAAAVLAHWSGALAVAVTAAMLLAGAMCRPAAAAGAAVARAGAAGIAAGSAVLALVMAWMHRGATAAWRSLLEGFATRAADTLPLGAWAGRQWLYARENFSLPLLVAAGATAALLAWLERRDRTEESPGELAGLRFLRLAAAATAVSGVLWVVAFRQGSFVHSYWQLWLALPVALLAGEAAVRLRSRPRLAVGAAAVWVALAAHLVAAGAAERRAVAAAQPASVDDVAFLASLRDLEFDRLVFFATAPSPLNEWFDGPEFLYYTDRPVRVAAASERLSTRDLALLLRQPGQAQAASRVAAHYGVRFDGARCGGHLCAYIVAPP